jgi:hypothetical protein
MNKVRCLLGEDVGKEVFGIVAVGDDFPVLVDPVVV